MAGAIYNREFDVVICGGGVSGCTAAIAAARSKMKTKAPIRHKKIKNGENNGTCGFRRFIR